MMTPNQERDRKVILTTAHTDYEKRLGRYAFFKVNDKGMSKDLVQDTFMKTWVRLAKGGEDRHHEGLSLSRS